MKILLSILAMFILPSISFANDADTLQLALEEENNGNHEKAIELYTELAEQGDTVSMIHIGGKYYNGEVVTQDYKKSMEWWIKAFKKGNGDAPGNIGVLYRDGKGVKQNRKIAYLLFAKTHMEGLGSQSTQYRVNSHLRREIAEQSHEDIQEALCYTSDYLFAYLEAKGDLKDIPPETLPSSGKIRFKDNNWWLPSEKEQMKFSCKPPWN